MKTPQFDEHGSDDTTFEPFCIEDQRDEENQDVRLGFYDFQILEEAVGIAPGDEEIDGNLMGEILCGIIDDNNLIQHPEGKHPGGYYDNCEGSACYFHFNHLDDVIRVAEFCIELFKDKARLTALLAEHGISAGDDEEED
jgi:hypothetical protein